MSAALELDYPAWIAQFPAFSTVPKPVIQGYWDVASEMVGNMPCCGILPLERRRQILNYLTAHLAQMFSGPNGQGASGVVGRITSATEGSVSVSAGAMGGNSPSAEWYNQTQYGALVWMLLGPYRSARYVPGPQRSFEPIRYGWARGMGWRGR